jgi:hypothetical protein
MGAQADYGGFAGRRKQDENIPRTLLLHQKSNSFGLADAPDV